MFFLAKDQTKKLLATSLKVIMLKKPLDKITIQELTEEAHVTRNTFYYHFSDIYQLVEWIYDHEIVSGLSEYQHLRNWHKGYEMLLNYVLANKSFCLNTSRSLGRDLLENFLFTVASQMLVGVIDEIKPTLPESLKQEIIHFYGWALVAQITQWLKNNLNEPKEDILLRTETMMNGAILKCVKKNQTA